MRELRDTAIEFRDLEDDVKAAQTRINEAKQDQEHALRCYLNIKQLTGQLDRITYTIDIGG